MDNDLTEKQQKFCELYLVSRNAMQSAIDAGYSKGFAKSKSYKLLQDPKIIAHIKSLEDNYFDENLSRLAYESITVLEEILREGFDDKVRLAAAKEVLKLSGIERRIEKRNTVEDTVSDDVGIQIVFNEVASREA